MARSCKARAFCLAPRAARAAGERFSRTRQFLSRSISAHEAGLGCSLGLVRFLCGQGLLKPAVPFFTPRQELHKSKVQRPGLRTSVNFGS